MALATVKDPGNVDTLDLPQPPRLQKVPSLHRRKSGSLNENQIKEYKEAWKLFDLDGDGYISREELASLMKSTGQFNKIPDEEELQRILDDADQNGDGEVDFDEFLEIMSRPPSLKEEIKGAFEVFDTSERGFFDFGDIKEVMLSIGENITDDEALSMFREADVDKDGRITLEDMMAMIRPPMETRKLKRRNSTKLIGASN
mmetsp:Transcript_16653/g.41024  ORF Transcript_16653/g.41024 Transcript_16653/m.41024 type:complete len:201 (-) Transcript_16653:297-899(-)|eukprot:CAMPEP_0114517810 /NCGR_PEP_ID=MMETSP0109-20121206/18099_1 /TAXON_ID=29199 /ORGANISM="Chlorarachnion reptans, Strain CCCM449" /LENGTH=200 /DNA_ID=CAMNT_0001698369 /DNA_START=46 /DNA_END=648 /DNA_ORIENTATION=+